MRNTLSFAFAALLLAFALMLSGCTGSSGGAPAQGTVIAGNGSQAAQPEPVQLPEGQQAPPAPPAVQGENGGANASAAANYTTPDYVNYCYPTYWKGVLTGTGRNSFGNDLCGDYNYTMEIRVIFTVPFDLEAYLSRKDFNFMDCPGLPQGAANGSRDISLDGSFRSERNITSNASGMVDRLPDRQTSSSGTMYVSQPYAHGLVFATYPRQDAQGKAGKYPYMVVDRCTWDRDVWIQGYYEAQVNGAEAGNFSYSNSTRTIMGTWAMNGSLAGNYTLMRTD